MVTTSTIMWPSCCCLLVFCGGVVDRRSIFRAPIDPQIYRLRDFYSIIKDLNSKIIRKFKIKLVFFQETKAGIENAGFR